MNADWRSNLLPHAIRNGTSLFFGLAVLSTRSLMPRRE